MGTPDRVELLREAWRRAERDAKKAFVSNRVWRDGQPIRWLYRDPPDRDADSGWRVFARDEMEEYNDDSRNISLVSVGQLLERDSWP